MDSLAIFVHLVPFRGTSIHGDLDISASRQLAKSERIMENNVGDFRKFSSMTRDHIIFLYSGNGNKSISKHILQLFGAGGNPPKSVKPRKPRNR